MTVPSSLPVWATTAAAADKSAPDVAKQQSGFAKVAGVPEKPPYQDFNWYMNLVYQWVLHWSTTIPSSSSSETIADNQAAPTNFGTLTIDPATFRAFELTIGLYVDATADVAATIKLYGVSDGSTWVAYNQTTPTATGSHGVTFSITAAGQVQYTSPSFAGYVSGGASWKLVNLEV